MRQYMTSLVGLEKAPLNRESAPSQTSQSGIPPMSPRALWGEVVAAVSVDAASRGVQIELEVDDELCELSHDAVGALRVFKTLVLAAIRLTAKDACLRISVLNSADEQCVQLDSVCCGSSDETRPMLYRAARSLPSEAGFPIHATRAFLRPYGGSIDARFMQDLGVSITLRVPRGQQGASSSSA